MFLVPESRDITEVKRTESALLKSEKLAAVGRLASSIAHEINNPLESVMNLIYLARNADSCGFRSAFSTLPTRRFAASPSSPTRRCASTSRPRIRRPPRAADLFSTVMSIYEGRLRNAHVRVEKRFRTDRPVVCFQGDVRQVLNNLVANALEAMPLRRAAADPEPQGPRLEDQPAGLVLSIADNGAGINPSVRKQDLRCVLHDQGNRGKRPGLMGLPGDRGPPSRQASCPQHAAAWKERHHLYVVPAVRSSLYLNPRVKPNLRRLPQSLP